MRFPSAPIAVGAQGSRAALQNTEEYDCKEADLAYRSICTKDGAHNHDTQKRSVVPVQGGGVLVSAIIKIHADSGDDGKEPKRRTSQFRCSNCRLQDRGRATVLFNLRLALSDLCACTLADTSLDEIQVQHF